MSQRATAIAKLKTALAEPPDVIERRMRYLSEADIRLAEVKNRVRGAQHYLRRRERERAQEELMHVINEARKLHLHLEAWENYV